MAHISLPEGFPGISGLMVYRPETAKPLNELAQALLHAPSTLTQGERELIATYVSSQNDCYYCQTIHGAIAAHHLQGNEKLVLDVRQDYEGAEISYKLKALLAIAGKVWKGGKYVTPEDIARAPRSGRHRSGNPRCRTDCRCFLHVQPLCGRTRDLAAPKRRFLSLAGSGGGRERVRQS